MSLCAQPTECVCVFTVEMEAELYSEAAIEAGENRLMVKGPGTGCGTAALHDVLSICRRTR